MVKVDDSWHCLLIGKFHSLHYGTGNVKAFGIDNTDSKRCVANGNISYDRLEDYYADSSSYSVGPGYVKISNISLSFVDNFLLISPYVDSLLEKEDSFRMRDTYENMMPEQKLKEISDTKLYWEHVYNDIFAKTHFDVLWNKNGGSFFR